jgi:hypothetical protein
MNGWNAFSPFQSLRSFLSPFQFGPYEKGAPTNLVRAGAFAGLIAGGVSAMAYALHCTDDSLPFIAVWYGGTIVLCTLAGAALRPRPLRW